ncbi:histone H1, sperm [Lepeophtheirus salmonis]|uniref:Putative LOC725238 [Apis mellifera] n=1 Tax=Lepeophtheirus salmonis TaxID=72036 RepID=A0A0K2UJY7_LEPSM|nr:histone H1-like [Lepeophtheirus salmonis]XP_040568924.1 histone H1-like [Lepeophtheirus salmonis]
MSPATPKKTSSKVSKDGSKAPPSSMMVKSAIRKLAERKGSSLAAIKKYISAHYKVDMVKRAPFICKAIRSAVEKGELVQTKGKGASGTFKLPVAKKSKDTKTDVMPKSTKKPTVKKASKAKAPVKKTPKKKTVKSKTPKKATKSKAKSPKKSPTKKAVSKASVKKTTKRTASKKA